MRHPLSVADREAIQEQLEKILRNAMFVGSPRLSRFLSFAVRESLQGKDDTLKESILGMEVFGKSSTWDSRDDSIVRTSANRLRSKLRAYCETEGRADAIRIEFDEGSYVPRFLLISPSQSERADKPEAPSRVRPNWRTAPYRGLWAAAAAIGFLTILTVIWGDVWVRLSPRNRPTDRRRSAKLPGTTGTIPDLILSDRIFAAGGSEAGSEGILALPVRGVPVQLTMTPEQAELYILNNLRTEPIQVIDLSRFVVTRTIPVPGGVTSFAFDTNGRTMYVGTDSDGLHIFERDTNRWSVVREGIHGKIWSVLLIPDEKLVYLTLGAGGLVRYDIRQRRVFPVWTDRCPVYFALDPDGTHLYISCRCGPGQSTAHDTIEVVDLKTQRTMRIFKGPPMVAGSIYLFPTNDRLWAEGLDACLSPRYRGVTTDCPAFPGTVSNIFRVSDGSVVKVLGNLVNEALGPPVFAPDGGRAITGGHPARVLDTTFFTAHEAFTLDETEFTAPVIDYPRHRLYLGGVGSSKVYALPLPQHDCDPPALGRAHLWPGDGTLADTTTLVPLPLSTQSRVAFSPGLIGQAFRLDSNRIETTTASTSLDAFTERDGSIIAWVKPTGNERGLLAALVAQGTWIWNLAIQPNLRLMFGQPHGKTVQSSPLLQVGKWHHVALVAAGDRQTVYVDSTPAITMTRSATIGPHDIRTLKLGPFTGLLDEVAVYDRPLDPVELRHIMASSQSCLSGTNWPR